MIPQLRDAKVLVDITTQFRAAGFSQIEIDPDGYRQGALNRETSVQPVQL